MAQTKNIIFDLGGVLLNIDYNRTLQAFKDLGYPHFEKMYTQYTADAVFEKLETGNISPEDFYNVMMQSKQEGISSADITHAWNKMLLGFRMESLEFLEQLAKKI